jgi:cardiolipin synthase
MPDGPNLPTREPIRAEVAGNRLEVIERGDARLRSILDLIAGATTKLNVLMYMFNADEAGDAVRNALDAAACRGVDVKLLTRRSSSPTSGSRSSAAPISTRPTSPTAARSTGATCG